MKRPLWILGTAYATALLLASLVGLNTSLLLGVLCLAAVFCMLLFPVLRKRRAALAALLAAAAAFCVFFGVEALWIRPLSALYGTEQTVEGRVTETGDGVCILRVETESAIPMGTRVRLFYSAETPSPAVGDRLRAAVQVLEPAGDSLLPDKAAGIYLRAVCTGYGESAIEITGTDADSFAAMMERVRTALNRVIRRDLPGEEGALTAAVCLGDKSGLSDHTLQVFRRSGLSHLLAVSGLHMSVVAQIVLAFLLFLKIPRRCAAGLASVTVVLFMLLIGPSPSVVRAGVMSLTVLSAQVISRDADSRNSMGLALLLLTVSNPFAVWDVGLLLSFAATFGLIVLAPEMLRWVKERWRRQYLRKTGEEPEPTAKMPVFLRIPAQILCVTVSALLSTLPIVAFVFRELSTVALLSNLLSVWAMTVLLPAGCLGMLLGLVPFLSWISHGLLLAAGLAAKCLLALADGFSSWSFAALPMNKPWLLVWLTGSLLLLWLGWRLLGKRGLVRAGALAVLLFSCGLGLNTLYTRGVTTLTAIEAGDNLSLLLERDGHAGLVAAGGDPDKWNVALSALQERGVKRLDFLLIPEWDDDMAAGLPLFVQRMPVESLVYSAEGAYRVAVEDTAAVTRQWVTDGDAFTFWNEERLEYREGGWMRLTLGDTRVLLCPPAGDVSALSSDWRNTHLAVFTGTPPLHTTTLQAKGAVFGCYSYQLPQVTKALPWGLYPVRLTAAEGTVTAATRGVGDLTIP